MPPHDNIHDNAAAGHRDRRRLPHGLPPWLLQDGCYLLTVCTTPRGRNQLAQPTIAPALREGLHHHHARAAWHMHALVVMPDHVHVLVTVPTTTKLPHVVINGKRFIARHHGVRWQQDFFEHRLRASEHFDAKLEYLRQNPVRAGLVSSADEWPFFYVW